MYRLWLAILAILTVLACGNDNNDNNTVININNGQNNTQNNGQNNTQNNVSVNNDALCSDTCATSNDQECDDGGPNSDFASCELGTDCADCGARGPSSCSDQVQNGNEEGVDCGGDCPDACATEGTCTGVPSCDSGCALGFELQGCEVSEGGFCLSTEENEVPACTTYDTETECVNDTVFCGWTSDQTCQELCLANNETECDALDNCLWRARQRCEGTPQVSCDSFSEREACEKAGCAFN